jgi:hypothetical protein
MANNSLKELAIKYENKYLNAISRLEMMKIAFIRKMPNGKWRVLSEKGKTLGTYFTKEQAVTRLRQIEYFKHKKKKKRTAGDELGPIDLTSLEELAYSGVMRELRKQCDVEAVQEFLKIFKKVFDALVMNGEENPAEKAMPVTIVMFGKNHNIELNEME